MKSLNIIGILAVSSLLIGCRSNHTPQATTPQATTPQAAPAQSDTAQSAKPQAPVDLVRNGYLKSNQTTTIGRALEHTFSNGTWKSFTTDKGVTIVEFDGSSTLGELYSPSTGEDSCSAMPVCAALLAKIEASCKTSLANPTRTQELNDQISALQEKAAAADQMMAEVYHNQISDLKGKLNEPDNACFNQKYDQNGSYPIPIEIQFSLNFDGSFQYSDTTLPWSQDKLFYKMYN
jgi:hypothetical protein